MMPAEPLPTEVADRLEVSRYQPAGMMMGYSPGPTESPALRHELHEAITAVAGDRQCGPVMYLELLGARARRFLGDLRPQFHHDTPHRRALEQIDEKIAAHGGRVVVAVVTLHR